MVDNHEDSSFWLSLNSCVASPSSRAAVAVPAATSTNWCFARKAGSKLGSIAIVASLKQQKKLGCIEDVLQPDDLWNAAERENYHRQTFCASSERF